MQDRLKFFLHLVTPLLLISIICSAISLFYFSQSITDSSLPLSLRSTLFSQELIYTQFLLLILAIPALALSKKIATIWLLMIFLLVVLFSAVNWFSFTLFNSFLNIDTLVLIKHDYQQLLHHISQINQSALITIPLMLVAALATYIALQWLSNKYYQSFSLLVISFNLVLLIVYFYFSIVFTYFSQKGQMVKSISMTYSEAYQFYSKAQIGPFSTFISDTATRFLERQISLDLSGVDIIYDPISNYHQPLKSPTTTPNIIVILIESLRTDQLTIYGGQRNVMPNLQKLAEQSLVYLDTLGQSSHSSYADLVPLSSHYPLRDNYIHFYPSNPTYPRFLLHDLVKPFGYRTAVISSQNEHWGNMHNYLKTDSLDALYDANNYGGEHVSVENNTKIWLEKSKLIAGKIDDKDTITGLIQWISSHKEQPFSVYTNLQSSHYPFELKANFVPKFSTSAALKKSRKAVKGMALNDAINLYADSLAYIDIQLGRLFDTLKQQDLWDNTIIVVSSDTAFSFNENGIFGNGGPLEQEVIKLPLIIKAPNISHKIVTKRARHLDILPTITDLMGLPPHPSYQGRSLLSPYNAYDDETFMVAQTPIAFQYAVIKGPWKLLWNKRSNYYFLFNLDDDPSATTNILEQHPTLAKELAYRLHVWIDRQIAYYENSDLHKQFYPPKLKFNKPFDF